MKEANVITTNFIRVNQVLANVDGWKGFQKGGGKFPIPTEPDAWLWENGDTVLWDDGTEMLLENVQQD